MFSYIIATNSVTSEITKSIELLSKTKNKNDKIILINYNRIHIAYRKPEYGVDYRHIKMSRADAINSVLPECGNVVLFANRTRVSKTFVRDISKFFDRHSLQTLRTDKSSKNGKFVESDYRIGSIMTPKSFRDSSIAFNTSVIPQIDDDLSITAKRCMDDGVSLRLMANVKTIKTDTVSTKRANVGITVIIPNRQYSLSEEIKGSLLSNDRIIEFDENPRNIRNIVNKTAIQSTNDCILLISPYSNIYDSSIINRIRSLYNNSNTILFDNSLSDITQNAWLITNKDSLSMLPRHLTTTTDIINHVVDKSDDLVRYNEVSENPQERIKPSSINNSISIIIPFKYNGDRWPLFKASVENLHRQTKDYDNIEIVVHEASDKRHITPAFIKKYNLVYLFSEYKETFHKSWVMNIACKYVANGDTFVFFDADMIVDHGWVVELLNCDKSRCLYGWGRIFNLNKEATAQYLKDGTISNGTVKISKPNIKTSAGGITLMPRYEFFRIGGWLESYKNMGYGGQDNSMAYKMESLGLYNNKEFSECTFISSIWHLFHGHQIKKEPKRLDIHKEHSEYTRQNWYEYIEDNHVWGQPTGNIDIEDSYKNDGLIYALTKTKRNNITVCISSSGDMDRLYNTISMLSKLRVVMNLILWIDGEIPQNMRTNIKSLCQGFRSHKINQTSGIGGSGYPHFMMINQSIHECKTPYIVVLRDDVVIETPESLVAGVSVLRQDKYSDYGVIGVGDQTSSDIMKITQGNCNITKPSEGLNDTDIVSSMIMTINRDMMKRVMVDPEYRTSIFGWDLCMSMKQIGAKSGLITDHDFSVMRSTSKSGVSQDDIDHDLDLFRSKWGIDMSDIDHLDIVRNKSNK